MALGAHHRDLKQLRAWFRDRDARRIDGVFVVEGPRTVDALLAHDRRPRAIYVDGARPELGARFVDAGISPIEVAPGVLDRIADARSGQGVVAVFASIDPAAARAAVGAARRVMVVVRVNDPGNAGTIARSAQAFGFDGMVVGPGSVDPYNPKTVRAGAGAVGSLPIWIAEEEDALRGVLHQVRQRGGIALGAEADGVVDLDDAPLTTEPLALVVGHETRGLAGGDSARDGDWALDLGIDATVRIPMAAGPDSLNVAMAATVLTFEVARRRAASTR